MSRLIGGSDGGAGHVSIRERMVGIAALSSCAAIVVAVRASLVVIVMVWVVAPGRSGVRCVHTIASSPSRQCSKTYWRKSSPSISASTTQVIAVCGSSLARLPAPSSVAVVSLAPLEGLRSSRLLLRLRGEGPVCPRAAPVGVSVWPGGTMGSLSGHCVNGWGKWSAIPVVVLMCAEKPRPCDGGGS